MRATEKKDDSSVIKIDTKKKWVNLALLVLCLVFIFAIRLEVNHTVTGDEPHYLSMDYALVHYHSLNLYKIYKNDIYTSWFPFPGGLNPQNPQLNIHPGKIYSTHGIGLPLFLFPGFLIAAKDGAVFEMVLLATAVVWLTWLWTYIVTKNRKVAYLSAFILAICYFFNGLVGAIYPDMLIAALTLAILIMLERYYEKPWHHFVIGILLGFLILSHIKTLYIVIPVMAVLTFKTWKKNHKIPWATYPTVLAFIAYYFTTFHQWFGTWSISSAYGNVSNDFKNNPLVIGAAQLFDSDRGLLVYCPILLLIFVGLFIWYKKDRHSFIITMIVLLPSIAAESTFNQWNGGESPLGRYMMDFVPALIPSLAFAIIMMKKVWQRLVIALLAAITFFITLDATLNKFPLVPGGLNHPPRSVLFTQIQQHTGLAIDKLLPLYSTNVTTTLGRYGVLKTTVGYLIVVLLIVYGYFLSLEKDNSDKKALCSIKQQSNDHTTNK